MENLPTVPQYPVQQTTEKKKHKIYDMNNKDVAVFFLIIASIFAIFKFGVFGGFNLGFAASIAVFLVISFCAVIKKNGYSKIYGTFLFLISLSISISFSFNDDGLIKFFDVLMIALLCFVSYFSVSGNKVFSKGSYKEISNDVILSLLDSVENIFTPFASILYQSKSGKNKKTVQILIGCLIALPFMCVIIPLLVTSDIAFENLLKTLFSDVFLILVCVVLTVLFTPIVYSYITVLRKNEINGKTINYEKIEKKTPATIINTVLSFLSVAYVMYLISQLAYITKAFAFLLPADYSVAEFARDGFFQMLIITIINIIIVGVACVLEKRKSEKVRLSLSTKILCIFLLLFTLFYIVNAFIRMIQYVNVYGLTYLRVTSSVFMIMTFIITLTVLAKLFIKRLPYGRIILVVSAFTLVFLSYFPANTIVSRYNSYCYKTEKITDISNTDIELLRYEDIENLLSDKTLDEETKDLYITGLYEKMYCDYDNYLYIGEENKIDLIQSDNGGIKYNSVSFKECKIQKKLFDKYEKELQNYIDASYDCSEDYPD